MCFCSADSGLCRLWCQTLLQLASLSDAVVFALLSPSCPPKPPVIAPDKLETPGTFSLRTLQIMCGAPLRMKSHRHTCSNMLFKSRLWRKVTAFRGGQRSSWGCMCSNSWLPGVKEGNWEFVLCAERYNTDCVTVCVTPWNTDEPKCSISPKSCNLFWCKPNLTCRHERANTAHCSYRVCVYRACFGPMTDVCKFLNWLLRGSNRESESFIPRGHVCVKKKVPIVLKVSHCGEKIDKYCL